MNELPATEECSERSRGLDTLDTSSIVALIAEDQFDSVRSVLANAPAIARVVDAIAQRIIDGGRLHYVGAGTSGRLGVLDASEMPPTFGTDPQLVCAHIAGGDEALRAAIEGAEDDAAAGDAQMRGHVRAGDAVVGISASGGAAYVLGALRRARASGVYTVAIVNVDDSPLAAAAEDAIVLRTGAEILTGSTRLKAGTAQKIALNAISTAVMVGLGKVYDNLMVDVVATNAKLRSRAVRLVCMLAEVGAERAAALLERAGGRVKVAVVMSRRGVDAETASELLALERGYLRKLL